MKFSVEPHHPPQHALFRGLFRPRSAQTPNSNRQQGCPETKNQSSDRYGTLIRFSSFKVNSIKFIFGAINENEITSSFSEGKTNGKKTPTAISFMDATNTVTSGSATLPKSVKKKGGIFENLSNFWRTKKLSHELIGRRHLQNL